MSDDKLRQLLSALPEEDEIRMRAERARRRALARLEEPAPASRRWLWAPALAAAVVLVALGLWKGATNWSRQPLEKAALTKSTPPAQAPAQEGETDRSLTVAAQNRPASKVAAESRARPRTEQPRLELHLVLSDGTRVQWILDKNFKL